jgi:hypothetical protein
MCQRLYESGDHAFSWYSQARMWRECAAQLAAALDEGDTEPVIQPEGVRGGLEPSGDASIDPAR